MPPHSVGSDNPRVRKTSALRGLGFSLAVVLGAVAIWLIVTSTSQKRIEIGVLAGLWGLLLGAFAVFGSRHPQPAAVGAMSGQEVALRGTSDVERADDAAARRHFEARLEHMLRREIQTSMSREVSALREEVSSLRTELLDKVGGQLRLERIETTRVIGSDIEAIKREVNQLKGARLFGEPGQSSAPVTRITSSRVVETESGSGSSDRSAATVRAFTPAAPAEPEPDPEPAGANDAAEIHDAVVVEEPATAVFAQPAWSGPLAVPEPPKSAPAAPAPVPVAPAPPAPAPAVPVSAWTAPPKVEVPPAPVAKPAQFVAPAPFAEPGPAAPPAPPAPPAPEPTAINDTFAGLPRLRPFTDFELDPIEPTPDPPDAYSGRRRADNPPPPRRGRHGSDDDAEAGGRRRRRAEGDDNDDVLSRILQRESAR